MLISSLERVFIENRIYRDIEEKTTWDEVISTIDKGLEPFKKNLKREVSVDDIKKLTEIPIRKISKFDLNKVKEKLSNIEINIEEVKNNLNHIIDYTIQYFTHLKKHYGKERKRKTIIEEFDDLDKKKISIKNQKLYVNKEEGFIGTSLKKDEYISDCSDLDDVIIFTKEGIMKVVKVDSKVFIGKDILHASLFNSDFKEKTYNLIYRDGKNGTSFMKRFKISGVIRDKEYNLTQGKESSEVLYFSANTKGIADVVTIHLRKRASIKKTKWEVDFADLAIKGRDSKGNIVTKHSVNKIELKEKGVSTLKPRKIWFDDSVQRLNVDGRGELLGEFRGEDKLLIIRQNGILKTISPEITTRFNEDMIVLEKWLPKKPISAIYFDGEKEKYFLKGVLS